MAKCPQCGKGMEDGFLGAQNWPAGLQWFRSKNFLGIHGEPIGESDLQMVWLPAARCPDCRLFLAPY